MRLCRTDTDNVKVLRCPYHNWVYRNDGSLLTAGAESHYREGELEKDKLGLIPVAKLGIYKGLIFATWDEHAEPLESWLGDARWYLDIIFGRTGEVEFVGVPQIWEAECSWKIATDNFTDNFHVFWTHRSLVQLGLLPNVPDFASYGHMVTAGNGHVLHFVQGTPNDEAYMGLGLPKDLWPEFEKHLTPEQKQVAMGHGYSAGTVWPNFHWLQLTLTSEVGGEPLGVLNPRLQVPVSPTRTRMYSWLAVDKGASAELRKRTHEGLVRTMGPAGIFDQDDMENWEECTLTAMGPAAKRHTLHHKMGINRPVAKDWPGPGVPYEDSYGEMTQRAWYAEWLRRMSLPLNGTNKAVSR
jgi:PAH dioxygenase large subunit